MNTQNNKTNKTNKKNQKTTNDNSMTDDLKTDKF